MGEPVGEAALIEAAAHVFVADVEDPVCDDADLHHLARVLRLRPGEIVTACDGAGRWRLCQVRPSTLETMWQMT